MSASVSLVGGDHASKALTEFMLNRRVDVPANATATGRPGDWSVDDEKLYMCLAQDDWFAIALVPGGNRVEVSIPVEDEAPADDADAEKTGDEDSNGSEDSASAE